MAITLTNADSALKNYYLDAIAEQLNYRANPLLAKINQTSNYVYGKEIKKLTTFGINGGIGAGTEDGNLPKATGNNYAQMSLPLKNLYGTIEISDKAIRASENNAGAFANLLTSEMEGLVKSSSINLARMLFGDGTGTLGKVVSITNGVITFDAVENFVEGMVIEFRTANGEEITGANNRTVLAVDKTDKSVTVSGTALTSTLVPENSIAVMQGSYNNEITGLGAIFGSSDTLYGLSRNENSWLKPTIRTSFGNVTGSKLLRSIDDAEERSGSKVNLILCSFGVKRSIYSSVGSMSFVEMGKVNGGYTSLYYNDIPVVADRFCPKGCAYLLNTDDFELHQLCDWQWLEGDDGRILKQVSGKPVYTATLVKYADLICSKPCGQVLLTGVTESV